jgi:hypothetical protein
MSAHASFVERPPATSDLTALLIMAMVDRWSDALIANL